MINKLKIDGVNKTLTEDDLMPYTYTFTKAQVHTVNFGLDNSHEICAYAFDGCSNLTSIEFPEEVTMIKRYAFRDCIGLKSMTIPSTIDYIGKNVFDGCSNLGEVSFKGITPPKDYYATLPTKTIAYIPDDSKYKVIDYSKIDPTSSEQYFSKTDWNQFVEINDKAGIDPQDTVYVNSWKAVGDDKHVIEEKNRVPVRDIEFDETTIRLYQGQKYKLSYTLVPENTTNHHLTWFIKNENLLTVSDADLTGQIELQTTDISKNYGDTTVTVYAESGQFKVLTFKIAKSSDIKAVLVTRIPLTDFVVPDNVEVSNDDPTSIVVSCTEGDKFTFNATPYPPEADNLNISITCDDPNVIIKGTEITLKASGTFYIKVKSLDEGGAESIIKIVSKTQAFTTLAKVGYNDSFVETLGESGAPETVGTDVIWYTSQRFGIKIDDLGGTIEQVAKDAAIATTVMTNNGTEDQLKEGVVKINNKGKWYEFMQPANFQITHLDIRMLPNKLKGESVGSWLGFDQNQVKVYDIVNEKYLTPETINIQEYSKDFAALLAVHQETLLIARCNSHYDLNASQYRVEVLPEYQLQPIYIICGDGTDTNANSGTNVSITEKKDRINPKDVLAANKAIYANIKVYGTSWEVELSKLTENKKSFTGISELSGLCDSFDHSGLIGVSDKGSIHKIDYVTGESTVLYAGTGEDIEAVTMDADGNIYYVNEANNSIMKLDKTETGYASAPVKVSRDEDNLNNLKKDPTDETADGFEGITWIEDDVFVLAHQKKYKYLVKYSLSRGVLDIKETFFAPELADIFYDKDTKHFYVLCSDESFIYELDENYKVIGIFKLPIIAVRENPEALWVDTANKIFFVGCDITKNLYVVPFNEEASYGDYGFDDIEDTGSDEGSVDDTLYIETITASNITAVKDNEVEVSYEIYPPAPDDSTVLITCDNDKVTINGNKVSASEAGEYTLTLKAKEGPASTTIKFTVSAPVTLAPGSIKFNEVNCGDKKVEIYNTTDSEISLEGLTLKGVDEAGADRDDWSFPVGAKIAAHGFYIWTHKAATLELGPSYGLSGSKAWKLSIVDGTGTVIDSLDYDGTLPLGTPPNVWARTINGVGVWEVTTISTIGSSNEPDVDPITITGSKSVLVKLGDPVLLNYTIDNLYNIVEETLTCDSDKVTISEDNTAIAIPEVGEYKFTVYVKDVKNNELTFEITVKVYQPTSNGITAEVSEGELVLTDADATVAGTEMTIIKVDSVSYDAESKTLEFLQGSSELTAEVTESELSLLDSDTVVIDSELTITNDSTVVYDEETKTLILK